MVIDRIVHNPIFDTLKIEDHYSKKDGVDVKYVCTSALNHGTLACDVFYRETPHPEFGNHYFALYINSYSNDTQIMITNADRIEELEFGMVEGSSGWEYSQHRHDFRDVEGSDCSIDGGRAYVRRIGNLSAECKMMKLVDGKFEEIEDE